MNDQQACDWNLDKLIKDWTTELRWVIGMQLLLYYKCMSHNASVQYGLCIVSTAVNKQPSNHVHVISKRRYYASARICPFVQFLHKFKG